MRFLADFKAFRPLGLKGESNVVMVVRFLPASLGNTMDVEIENLFRNRCQRFQARFFEGFAQRHRKYVRVSVGVPPQLEPFIEFSVVG